MRGCGRKILVSLRLRVLTVRSFYLREHRRRGGPRFVIFSKGATEISPRDSPLGLCWTVGSRMSREGKMSPKLAASHYLEMSSTVCSLSDHEHVDFSRAPGMKCG